MEKAVMYVLDSDRYFEKIVSIFKYQAKGARAIYVSTNKPFPELVRLFSKAGIDTGSIFFIDCISRLVVQEPVEDRPNCIYVDSPQDTTAIGIAVTTAARALEGEKVVMIDSLSTMLLYNEEKPIGQFSNFIINRMRVIGVTTCLFVLDTDLDKNVVKTVKSFVDEVKQAWTSAISNRSEPMQNR